MGEVHRKTFTFLVDFMKDLVQFSDVNGLEPKILGKYLEIWPFDVMCSLKEHDYPGLT